MCLYRNIWVNLLVSGVFIISIFLAHAHSLATMQRKLQPIDERKCSGLLFSSEVYYPIKKWWQQMLDFNFQNAMWPVKHPTVLVNDLRGNRHDALDAWKTKLLSRVFS